MVSRHGGGEHPPVREGVLGQVQVGEVSTAAPQQGPKQLAERQRDKWVVLCSLRPMWLCCTTAILALECCTNGYSIDYSWHKMKSEVTKKNHATLFFPWPKHLQFSTEFHRSLTLQICVWKNGPGHNEVRCYCWSNEDKAVFAVCFKIEFILIWGTWLGSLQDNTLSVLMFTQHPSVFTIWAFNCQGKLNHLNVINYLQVKTNTDTICNH